jgi:type I restriction enzyme S subunit
MGRYMIRGQDYSESKGWANPNDVFRVGDGIEHRYRNSRVREGDLIMTIVGYCGHVEMVPRWLDGANLTQTTARIAIRKDSAVPAFCKYMLQSAAGRNQVAAYLKGAAQPGLNCGDVEEFLVPMPPMPEQTAIAVVLSDMDAELAALDTKLTKVRQLKQGMMQELLTGRIRLV